MAEYQITTKARWKKLNFEYTGVEYHLYLGKLLIAKVSYDGVSSRGVIERQAARKFFPEEGRIGNFATIDEARKACHFVIDEVINLLQAE